MSVPAETILAENADVIRGLTKRVIGDIIEIGRRLSSCRTLLKEGTGWRHWLETELRWSPQTAGRYIQVWEATFQHSNLEHLNLSISGLYLLAAPSTPEEARTEIIERAENGESLSVADVRRIIDDAGTKPCGTQGTGENEWYTPKQYIEAARAVLGTIDLDPASSEIAQRTVKASKFFTIETYGLAQEWKGTVWLNPPYAQPLIANFADKMIAEIGAGHVKTAIMLTHNYTDTAWFQKLAQAASSICFPRGRVLFEAPDGTFAAPTQGQTFFLFGNNPGAFFEVFRPLGFIARAVR
jgi:phage N-6-adenine-methyltransferase